MCLISSVSKEIQEEYTMYQPEKNIVRSKRREMGWGSGEKKHGGEEGVEKEWEREEEHMVKQV